MRPWNAAVESDELVALGVVFGQLDRRFDRFGAGVPEINALRLFTGSDRGEFFCEFDEIRIVKIRAGQVNEFRGLFLNRGDYFRMAMAGGDDGDTGGKIEESVAVNVFHHRTPAGLRDERIIARVGRREHGAIAFDDLFCLRTRERRDEVR